MNRYISFYLAITNVNGAIWIIHLIILIHFSPLFFEEIHIITPQCLDVYELESAPLFEHTTTKN